MDDQDGLPMQDGVGTDEGQELAQEGEGLPEGADGADMDSAAKDGDPYGVKKRLGQQAKKHQRAMRDLQSQVDALQHRLAGHFAPSEENTFHSPGQPDPISGTEDERIQKAVRYALMAKDAEEKRAKDEQSRAHVQKEYQRLNDDFDNASDRYEDFDHVVRGSDVPFTEAVRDALLLVHNPADVAYRLGKNRDDLERISKLHPLQQAREVTKLSFALMRDGSGSKKQADDSSVNSLGKSPRAMPPTGRGAVTGRTPVSDIRARLKAGTWK